MIVGKFGDSPWDRMSNSVAEADMFRGQCVASKKFSSAYLEMDGVREGASIKVNGKFAGGMIGAPYRLNVTRLVKPGPNKIEIEPYAPKTVRLVIR